MTIGTKRCIEIPCLIGHAPYAHCRGSLVDVDCHDTRIRVSAKFLIRPRNPYSGVAYLTTREGSS